MKSLGRIDTFRPRSQNREIDSCWSSVPAWQRGSQNMAQGSGRTPMTRLLAAGWEFWQAVPLSYLSRVTRDGRSIRVMEPHHNPGRAKRRPRLRAVHRLVEILPHPRQALFLTQIHPRPNSRDGLVSGFEALGDLEIRLGEAEDLRSAYE